MNRQAILLAAMGLVLLVFFSDTLLNLFDSGGDNIKNLSKPSVSTGIDYSGINALLKNSRPDSIAFTPNIWTNDFFFDRNRILKSQFMAIINDEIMKKGSKLLGFTIFSISDNKVRLKRNRDRITLELIE